MPAPSFRPLVLGAALALLACSPAGSDQKSPSHSNGGSMGQGGSPSPGAGSAGEGVSGAAGGNAPKAGESTGGSATAGTNATAGGGGGGSGGKAGGGLPCDGADIFCSEFEAATIPSEMVFWPEYLRATQQLITIDPSLGKSAPGSMKVTGTDSSQMLAVTVPSKFWGRVYLRSDTDIQSGHNTYMAAGTSAGDPNMGTYVRIGEHQCQLELNRNTDDKELLSNGGTYMCQGGVKLLKDTWYCIEFFYDGPAGETRVFVDDAEVTALHATSWGTFDFQVFKLGFEKYHGDAKTLWYDDLAIGSAQLGCL